MEIDNLWCQNVLFSIEHKYFCTDNFICSRIKIKQLNNAKKRGEEIITIGNKSF